MNEKKIKSMINELKNMNAKQLEAAKKNIDEIIKKIDDIKEEKKND